MQTETEIVGGEPYEFVPMGKHIVRAVGVCGGRPTFKYTRIEVIRVLNRLAGGETVDRIAMDYSGTVSREALLEATELAERLFPSSILDLVPSS
jgi:uncharacterized protein (DUF433 family)